MENDNTPLIGNEDEPIYSRPRTKLGFVKSCLKRNKLKSLKVAHVKDEKDGDEDEDDNCNGVFGGV